MGSYRVVVDDAGLSFEASAEDTLLGAALRAGIGFPYECNAGGCGSCKFTLVEGTVVPTLENCPGLKTRDKHRNKHLACISRVESDCIVDIRLDAAYVPKIPPASVVAEFVATEKLTHNLWEFTFKSPEPARFLPGQYAKVSVPNVDGPRSYSMSNLSNDEGIWQFQIKKLDGGAASKRLFEQPLNGLAVTIDAPYSIAHLRMDSKAPVVCIGGGSGLAPMFSIAKGLAVGTEPGRDLAVFYGARTEADVIDASRFDEIARLLPGARFIPVVSEPGDREGWTGATGLVHEYLAGALPFDISEIEFYIAGPPPMVDAVRRHLVLERGAPIGNLFYDRFF